jgi:hypothetical protein
MTANQRRPGFRLPWSSEEGDGSPSATPESPARDATPTAEAPAPADDAAERSADIVDAEAPTTPEPAAPGATPASANSPAAARSDGALEPAPAPTRAAHPTLPAEGDASPDFMRELVTAMRRVADEARQTGITDVRATADERVKRLEAEAETRRNELRARADADVAGIGEWAKAEAERIRKEAEERVVARRGQLDQQLSGETARAEAEAKALRDRVAGYERELEAYHAQLAEINDPAAFAAAAKRMPRPPSFESRGTVAAPAAEATSVAPATTVAAMPAERPAETNGVKPSEPEVHPAEEQVLASRLAELDAKLADAPAESGASEPAGDPTTTEIVVSGLGSFGAITGFRQSLSGVTGIEGVALSLGQTGEFIFRATHRSGFDLASAITGLEGDGVKIEPRDDGSLHVTLDRAR